MLTKNIKTSYKYFAYGIFLLVISVYLMFPDVFNLIWPSIFSDQLYNRNFLDEFIISVRPFGPLLVFATSIYFFFMSIRYRIKKESENYSQLETKKITAKYILNNKFMMFSWIISGLAIIGFIFSAIFLKSKFIYLIFFVGGFFIFYLFFSLLISILLYLVKK